MAQRSKLGSIRERRPGVWEVCVSSGYREDKRKRTEYRTVYGTQRDAEDERAKLALEMGLRASLGMRSTIADYWPFFVLRCEAKGVARSTLRDYEKQWRLRIEPRFGNLRWSQLTFRDVKHWVYTLTRSQAEHAVRTLRCMINCAVDDELVERSILDHRRIDYPVTKVDPTAKRATGWTARDVAECMARIRGQRIAPLWLALVGGGLRPEEGLAMWWEDLVPVDALTVSGGILIHASVTKAWTPEDGLHGTKTRESTRVAPIPEPFASELESLRVPGERVPLWPLYPGRASREWKSLFGEGGPLEGMPYARLKDMRSAHETLMQEAGTLDTLNAAMHGRTNVQTGYKHYLRPNRAMDEAAENMGSSLFSA